MNTYLKLYNSKISIRLSDKEKKIVKKNAYKNKITMSEYIRLLILIDNRLKEIEINNNKNEKNRQEINQAKVRMGGIQNK